MTAPNTQTPTAARVGPALSTYSMNSAKVRPAASAGIMPAGVVGRGAAVNRRNRSGRQFRETHPATRARPRKGRECAVRSPPPGAGRSHLEILRRLADVAIAGRERARPPSSLLPLPALTPPPFQGEERGRDLKCDCPACEPEAPFLNRFPCPWQRERAEGARGYPLFAGLSRFIPVYPGLSWFIPVYPGLSWFIPVYPGLSRFIPVYPGLSRFISVHSGLSWSVPVYSGPSRPVPVAGGRKRMRSAERRVKGAARTAAPCRERRRVRCSPTPFGPRAVDGVHAPVDSIRSPPGQPRSSRAPGRPHLEISGRRADAAIAGRGARGRHLLSSLEGGRSEDEFSNAIALGEVGRGVDPGAGRPGRGPSRPCSSVNCLGAPASRRLGGPKARILVRASREAGGTPALPGAPPLPTSPLKGGGEKRAPLPDDGDVGEPPRNFQL